MRLSWGEKHAIAEECERRQISGTVHELEKIGNWAKDELSLSSAPSRITIERIFTNTTYIRRRAESSSVHNKKDWKGGSNLLKKVYVRGFGICGSVT